MKKGVVIQVPATSANLGPGFDSLGLALDLYDRFTVEQADGVVIEGCAPEHANEDNLFVRAYRRGLEELGLAFRGLRVRFDAEIPITRGLGSSSACIVGGLLAAEAAGVDECRNGSLDKQALLDLATEIEGHPDNVCPALLGGFAVSIREGRRVSTIRSDIDEGLVFNALVPPFPLETAKARAALPDRIGFHDAAFNAGRAAMVAAAFLSRDYGKLDLACRDRLHEPFRAPLIEGFREIEAAARESGALAVFLSGAGPTIMAICGRENALFAERMGPLLEQQRSGPWGLLSLHPDNAGATVQDR
ncbi:MAG: homoserine kinase [Treponema sp.]|nr:homoserine kinase [Treponema sp.]